MTLDNLIEMLEEIRNEGSGDMEVRIATQPTYPLAFAVGGVNIVGDEEDDEEPVVYIGTGTPLDYAPRDAWGS